MVRHLTSRSQVAMIVLITTCLIGCGSRSHFRTALGVVLPKDARVIAEDVSGPFGYKTGEYFAKVQISRTSFLQLMEDLHMQKNEGEAYFIGLGKNLVWWDPPVYERQVACENKYLKKEPYAVEGQSFLGRVIAQFYDGKLYLYKEGRVK